LSTENTEHWHDNVSLYSRVDILVKINSKKIIEYK